MSSVPRDPIRHWEIWKVRWHHLDDGGVKARPVLVLSDSRRNAQSTECWCVKIKGNNRHETHWYRLDVGAPEFTGTGLHKTSFVLYAHTRVVAKTDFLHRLGYLSPHVARQIDVQIRQIVVSEAEGQKDSSPGEG